MRAGDVAPIFPRSPLASPSPASPPRRRARQPLHESRSIIRDFVEHTIPRESFTHAPPGNAVVAEKSNQTRGQRSTSIARRRPEIASPRRKRTGWNTFACSTRERSRTVKVHSIFKCCGDITQSAASSMQSHCPSQSYASRRSLGQMEPYNRFIISFPFSPSVSTTTESDSNVFRISHRYPASNKRRVI